MGYTNLQAWMREREVRKDVKEDGEMIVDDKMSSDGKEER